MISITSIIIVLAIATVIFFNDHWVIMELHFKKNCLLKRTQHPKRNFTINIIDFEQLKKLAQ